MRTKTTGFGRNRTLPQLIILFALLAGAALAWWQRDTLTVLVTDRDALQTFVASLGAAGPLALISLNILQIIIAPLPGMALFFVSGYLFGPWWGAAWGLTGLLLGGLTAMWLARVFGRPLAQRLVGADRLAHWEHVTHSDSTVVWALILLAPSGDVPFWLAGFSRVRFRTIALLIVLVRGPASLGAAAVGAGAWALAWWQIGGILLLLTVPLVIGLRYRSAVTAWFNRAIRARLPSEQAKAKS